ncbi:hypothetical protein QLX67_02530 [Balneolaceae bacterium ANBcel3]|nr:hypothetical protein [Balneolaceae bacterium ANBcel3]
MNDFSDLLILLSAIVLFLLLSIQVNHFIVSNKVKHVQAEVDYHALTVAQHIIDEVQGIHQVDSLRAFIEGMPEDMVFTIDRVRDKRIPFEVAIQKESIQESTETLLDLMASSFSSGSGTGGGPPPGTPHAAPPHTSPVEAYLITIDVQMSGQNDQDGAVRMSFTKSF